MTLPIPQKLRWWAENRLQRIREIVIPVALVGGMIFSRVLMLAVEARAGVLNGAQITKM